MPNFFLTPNMGLTVPIATLEPGPDWANDINSSLLRIDEHDHSNGKGAQVTPDGINISKDLNFNGFGPIDVGAVKFIQQPIILPNTDVGALYQTGVTGDLFYNNAAGFPIPITNGNSLAGAAGTISGLPSPGASAAYEPVSGTFKFEQAPTLGANMDIGTLILRYPGTYPVPVGDSIQLRVSSFFTGSFALTLPFELPGQVDVMTLAPTGQISSISFDDVGNSMTSVGANAIAVTMTSVGANAIANTRTRPINAVQVPTGGIVMTGIIETGDVTSTSYIDITNGTVIIQTSGKPIRIVLTSHPNSASSGAGIQYNNPAAIGGCLTLISFFRDDFPGGGNPIRLSGNYLFDQSSSVSGGSLPPESVGLFDAAIVAGATYRYRLQIRINNPAGGYTGSITQCRLVAYEL